MVYSVIGREPFIIIGINGVLSIFAAYFLYRSILIITNDNKKALLGMGIFLFFPHNIIFSSIVLRESMLVFFVAFSLYMFFRYTYEKKLSLLFLSFILLSLASLLHAGVIFISIGYLYFLLKEKGYTKTQLLKKPLVFMLIITIVIVLFAFDDIFLRKLDQFDSVDSIVTEVSKGTENTGGSAYLQGYEINSLRDVALYAPLKLIYFFFSPAPWDIRNINDVIALLLDALIYSYFFIQLFKKVRNIDWREPKNQLFISLLFAVLITGLIFALGTSNAGTALRHRYKILVVIILAVFVPIKHKIKKNKNTKIYRLYD